MTGKKEQNIAVTVLFAAVILILSLVPVLEAKKKPKPPKKKTPVAADLLNDNVSQVLPNTVFANSAPDNVFFLSGWVCPGSSSALLALVTYNGAGKMIDSAGVEVASTSELTQLGFADEVGMVKSTDFVHPDYPGADFQFHRVFAKFSFTSKPSVKKIRILVQNSSLEVASCAVWFDGIKLEKAFAKNQMRPTAFHSKGNLLSPEFIKQIEGGSDLYEW